MLLASLSLLCVLVVGIVVFVLGFWLGMVYSAKFSKTQRQDIKTWADAQVYLMQTIMDAEVVRFRNSLTNEILAAQQAVVDMNKAYSSAKTRTRQVEEDDDGEGGTGGGGRLLN